MELVLSLLAFLTIFFVMISLIMKLFSRELIIHKRLAAVKNINLTISVQEDDLSKPLQERMLRPFLSFLGELAGKLLPQEKKATWHKLLVLAGNPWNLTANEFFVIRISMIIIFPLLFIIIFSGGDMPNQQKIIFYIIAAGIGYFFPELYLKGKWNGRRKAVLKDLPDTLDLLTVSVEAGLGFDAALFKVVEKSENVLAEEFKKVISETQMGKTRREALRDAAERLDVEELTSFINSLIQADTLGISVSKVLRTQSLQMRQKKRQAIEEKAMKAPVIMLIPMVLFIFPTIFLVLLGPAVIQIIQIFSNR